MRKGENMREILFRGKCTDTGKWYEGQYIHLHKTTCCFKEDYDKNPDNDIHQIVFERMTDWCLPNQHLRADVIPETVGQYTGLTDKNGKKIFEGDIVNIEYDTKVENAVIEYHGVSFYGATPADLWELNDYYAIEVIGNIHDNPELLEVE